MQKNKIMQKVISDMFAMPLHISDIKEEASVGAALFSAIAVGYLNDIEALSDHINYTNG